MKIVRTFNNEATCLEIPHENIGDTITVSITSKYGTGEASTKSMEIPKVLAQQLIQAVYLGMGLNNPQSLLPTFNVIL